MVALDYEGAQETTPVLPTPDKKKWIEVDIGDPLTHKRGSQLSSISINYASLKVDKLKAY